MLSRYDGLPERDGQTDIWTDGRTDGIAVSISHVFE